MSAELQPPPVRSHELEDAGAHELDSSEDSDAFVDASETVKPPPRSGRASPIPVTRVERVDDEPSYGEIPGTSAYKLRTADAVPDEIEVVPEGNRSRSASRVSRPSTPVPQVPKIVAEKIDPDEPAYGDVPGTTAYEMRKADAEPDEVVRSPASASAPANPFTGELSPPSPLSFSERLTGKASPTGSNNRSDADLSREEMSLDDDDDEDDDEEDGFGDDFDDFEEGQEADDDFGEFDEGFQHGSGDASEDHESPSQHPPPSHQQPSIPILNFSDLDDLESIQSACEPYLHALFPSYPPTSASDLPSPNQQIFLSERSVSLYTQLIAPPPLAPPNWLRSRIRRLFLVSLGVPVDLDEILPASKQKKLVLPSINLKSPDPNRGSIDDNKTPAGGPLGKLKTAHDSTASLSSTASGRKVGRRKGTKDAAALPDFDVAAARRLAQTTQERIDGMSDEELKRHLKEVERMNEKGRECVGYWERRVEEAGREKEAFEGVIENLIGFARKVRK